VRRFFTFLLIAILVVPLSAQPFSAQKNNSKKSKSKRLIAVFKETPIAKKLALMTP